MARHLLNLFLATSLGLLTSCGSSPADESTGSAHSNAKGLRVLGSLLSGVSQRELSVLSGTTSAYCGANCQEGYSAGNRGAQQCLNELPAAIPRVALNTLLEQGVRVLSTSEQRRMRMPDLPDPGVSWARWRVTCFYAAVLVEGRADVIDGFVQEYQRPIDMSPRQALTRTTPSPDSGAQSSNCGERFRQSHRHQLRQTRPQQRACHRRTQTSPPRKRVPSSQSKVST